TKEFWDEFEGNYEDTVISIFENKNELVKLINKIPDKNKKILGDFGSGVGKAIPYLLEFKKIYQIDFSENMLSKAKEKYSKHKNIQFILGTNENTKLNEKLDIIIAINSIFPLKHEDFDSTLENFIENTHKDAEIILVLASFEFKTFRYHLEADFLFSKNQNPLEIRKYFFEKQREENFNPFGYFISLNKIVQKQWLKEEIFFRLKKFHFKSVKIQKLKLTWNYKQLKNPSFNNYPNPWYWLVKIKK
ncbi:class I SAM-dependent methyltransferase, partial [bacterium]|nr:class I SAM-dependent methyltransferase [bacterium]